MEITKLSTKGQIVIPESLRSGFQEGSAFTVARKGDIIMLKIVEGLTTDEVKEMQELDKVWKDIDAGKGITLNQEDFLKEMETW